MLTITRKLEFDAGHRIPDHNSQCRNLHGHRYALHLTLTGEIVTQDGRSDKGMIMDFSDIKALANKYLVDEWDHAFLVYENDLAVRQFLESLPNHKTVVLNKIPTVENLAQIAFDRLKDVFQKEVGLRLVKVTLYETPNCWAEVSEGASA
ncbi:MAG: 6-carboxytetrahydropterin synthase QueD [Oxalobacter sp.]|nr:MAG: 6-carboxytetrahydropterin synthase QueD [Oxalobacter sp.]